MVRTVVESGGGEPACFEAHSMRIDGMKGGTSKGKARTREEMPRTAESGGGNIVIQQHGEVRGGHRTYEP
jgi:hypothetical protein